MSIIKTLSDEQAASVQRVIQYLGEKSAQASQLVKFLIQQKFPPELAQKTVDELKTNYPAQVLAPAAVVADENAAPSESAQSELIKKYFAQIYQRFTSDPLFLFELEAVARNKAGNEIRSQTFLDMMPYFLQLDHPSHASVLVHPKVRGLFQVQIEKFFMDPIRRIFLTPGRIGLKKFVLMTGLKGSDFIDVTAQLEKDGYLNVDAKKDELVFQVKKISGNVSEFRQYLKIFIKNFPEGEGTLNKIMMAYESSVQIPEGQPASNAIRRIQTKSIPFTHLDLNLVRGGSIMKPDQLHTALYEAYILLNFTKRSEANKLGPAIEPYVTYADKLTQGLCNVAENETLNAFQSKQLMRAFACLSILPGKSLKMINDFFKDRNALEFNTLVSILKKSHV